ncbi:MAG: hypothetical protein IJ564_02960 [Alphaproteobacteria bacterium]|nr:hypothetical protein [Alphaproteobacteria bacterium]
MKYIKIENFLQQYAKLPDNNKNKTFGNFDDIYEVEFPSIKKVMALSWIVMQNGNETMVWFVIPSSNKIDSLRLFIRPKDKKEWQEL